MLMDMSSAMSSELGPALRRLSEAHNGNRDPFHELLFHLTYQRYARHLPTPSQAVETAGLPLTVVALTAHARFVMGNKSTWWPYLALLPDPEEVGAPIIFNAEGADGWAAGAVPDHQLVGVQEMRVLGQLDIRRAIADYQQNVRGRVSRVPPAPHLLGMYLHWNLKTPCVRQFESVIRLPSVQKEIPARLLEWDAYRWGHYILDSRSIWWDGQRHLVPLLVSHPFPHTPYGHTAELCTPMTAMLCAPP
jgi:hypothetical protein